MLSGPPARKPTTGVPQQRLSAVTSEKVSRWLVSSAASAALYHAASIAGSSNRPISSTLSGTLCSGSRFPTTANVTSGMRFASARTYQPPFRLPCSGEKDAVTWSTSLRLADVYLRRRSAAATGWNIAVSTPFPMVTWCSPARTGACSARPRSQGETETTVQLENPANASRIRFHAAAVRSNSREPVCVRSCGQWPHPVRHFSQSAAIPQLAV